MTGEEVIKVWEQLKAKRSCMESHWMELTELYTPRRWNEEGEFPLIPCDELYTSKPQQCAHIMANGLAATIAPRTAPFYEFEPPTGLEDIEEVKVWFRENSEAAQQFTNSSNFFEEFGEFLLELVIYGTGAIFCGDLDDRGEVFYKNQPIGSYCIAEDQYGRVNCFYRCIRRTAEQAAEEFGADNLSDEIKDKLKRPEGKTEQFTFIHGVGKRRDAPKDDDAESKSRPWYSYVVELKSKAIVHETTYHEFPFAVARYRKEANWPYGFGPGTVGRGDARQVAFLNQMGDVGAERQVFPPMVAPSSMEGEIAQGPGEINYVDESNPNQAGMLRELDVKSDLNALQWRLDAKEADLEAAFHVPLFTIFAQRSSDGKQPLTATEANYIATEKIQQFSPIYGRLMSECMDVVLERLFNVLARAGKFQPAPEALKTPGTNNVKGTISIQYKNRIVLALEALKNGSFLEFLNVAGVVFQLYPEALDYFNLDIAVPDMARNASMPEEWIRKQREVKAIKAEREKQRQAQMQLMAAEQAAKATKDFSEAGPAAREAAGMAIRN